MTAQAAMSFCREKVTDGKWNVAVARVFDGSKWIRVAGSCNWLREGQDKVGPTQESLGSGPFTDGRWQSGFESQWSVEIVPVE